MREVWHVQLARSEKPKQEMRCDNRVLHDP